MKHLVSLLALMGLLLINGFAFAADDFGEKSGSAESKPPVFTIDDTSGKSPTLSELQEANLQKLLTEGKEKATENARISVYAEPGDGLIALKWSVSGFQQKIGMPIPSFTVVYGSESGNYTKKVSVGTATNCTLRELKNNQVYFVRIKAATPDEKVSLLSDEIRIIPLAIEEQATALERAFSQNTVTLLSKIENEPFNRNLKQFGYDFFKNSQANLAAADNLPVGPDYILGPGDALRIDIWGAFQSRYEATVDRNGEITLPKIGTVKVWGLTYAQAKDVINKAVGRYFKGYDLNLTLGKLRTIQVFVVGEVASPGAYTVSSLATVINALSIAGGPTKNGSLRTIRLSRGGKVKEEIDLYDMMLAGDRSKDIRLENGDTIFVSVIGPVAAVAGEVKRPGIYELKGKTTLPELLMMAGGITAAGDNDRLQVERYEGNSSRIVLDYVQKGGKPADNLANVTVVDRDMVKVFPVLKVLRQVVSLSGNVARPGEYQFKEGMRVKDIIPSFDALLPDSFLHSAEIIRLVPPDFHTESITFDLQKAIEGDEQSNLLLHEQDTIKVFSRWNMEEKPFVSVNGLVVNPGTYYCYPRMTVRDLITEAGSLKRNAYLESAELTRLVVTNGKAQQLHVNIDLSKALAGDPDHNLLLQPEDILIVRGVLEWLEPSDRLVTLKGEVRFPGVYSITKGERFSSVIARAGGFTDKAYLKGAKFTRKSVQRDQQKRMDEVIARTEMEIVQKQGELASLSASKEELDATKAALEGLMKGVEKLKAAKAEGRVVIHLAPLDELQKSDYDLEMIGGDILEIPQTPSAVNVMGQVYNATSFLYMPGKDIDYYLKKAGGPRREAEEGDMYIIKADGSVMSRQQSSFGIRWNDDSRSWTFGSFMSAQMDPGDTLVVPQKLERVAWMRDIKDITTILGQLALVAGVLVAAGL